MRKFIVSDLHGCGEVYDSIMGYLDNMSLSEDVELYINGDLIDRGLDGFRMLLDIRMRISKNDGVKIHYLGGNHELMMYQALLERKPNGAIDYYSDWIYNGGYIIEGELDTLDDGEELCEELKTFLGSLKIYHKFQEIVDNKNVVLVHAQCPKKVLDECPISISLNNQEVYDSLWMREERRDDFLWFKGAIIGYNRIGLDGYITIKGHTPIKEYPGIKLGDNYINIDGGCAYYALGHFDVNHVPLVEVSNDKLDIVIFNHNNEIIDGYYYDGRLYNMSDSELNKKREFINHKYDGVESKVKELIKEIYS